MRALRVIQQRRRRKADDGECQLRGAKHDLGLDRARIVFLGRRKHTDGATQAQHSDGGRVLVVLRQPAQRGEQFRIGVERCTAAPVRLRGGGKWVGREKESIA